MRCLWYAACDNEAVIFVKHPIIGNVPTCRRCADKHDLKGDPVLGHSTLQDAKEALTRNSENPYVQPFRYVKAAEILKTYGRVDKK